MARSVAHDSAAPAGRPPDATYSLASATTPSLVEANESRVRPRHPRRSDGNTYRCRALLERPNRGKMPVVNQRRETDPETQRVLVRRPRVLGVSARITAELDDLTGPRRSLRVATRHAIEFRPYHHRGRSEPHGRVPPARSRMARRSPTGRRISRPSPCPASRGCSTCGTTCATTWRTERKRRASRRSACASPRRCSGQKSSASSGNRSPSARFASSYPARARRTTSSRRPSPACRGRSRGRSADQPTLADRHLLVRVVHDMTEPKPRNHSTSARTSACACCSSSPRHGARVRWRRGWSGGR